MRLMWSWRLWCQWWKAGVVTSHSSGPKRQRRLAWMKKPHTMPSAIKSAGVPLPAMPGLARPITYRGTRPNSRVITMSTGWLRVLARKCMRSVL